MGGNRFGKECWGVFVCVVSQGLRALISAPLSVGGGVLTTQRGWRATNCLWKVFLVIASTKSAGAYVTGPLF